MEKYTSKDTGSYALGMSLSIEAIKHRPDKISKVILSNKAFKNAQLDYLLNLTEESNIEVIYDDSIINRLSAKENCYCIAFFDKFYDSLSDDEHILLYDFKDHGDLGTIIRSAVSFDFKNIALISSDIDYFDPSCIRASMGAIFHVNIVKYDSLDEYIKDYPEHHIYPFVSESDKELDTLQVEKPFSLLISENYYGLDHMDGYYIRHNKIDEISLSLRSSIILQKVFSIKS